MELLETEYYTLLGEPVEADSLLLFKAVELVQALQSQGLPYIRLVNCLRFHDDEIVVVDVEPEIPQHPVHDVRAVERVAIRFAQADTEHQLVLALRQDFPVVPHLHFGTAETPRCLCLYQTSYDDLKPTWTAAALLRQLQHWLTQTARGELHAADQALEQAFYAPAERLVLPSAFYSTDIAVVPEPVRVRLISDVLGHMALVALPVSASPPTEGRQAQFASFVYTAQPQVHGLIQEQPRTLAALQAYLSETDVDFLNALRQHLTTIKGRPGFSWDNKLLLIIRLPKQRTITGLVESMEVWAFASSSTLAEIGTDVGIWRAHPYKLVELCYTDATRTGQQSSISLLSPSCALTQELAAAYNGLLPTKTRFVAIGAGSLGSQIVNNLVRAGQGSWVWVDEDQYLPHNTARHYLPGSFVGLGKADAMVALLKTTYEKADLQAIAANVLRPATAPVTAAYEAAEVVLDMSASVAVARHLALAVESPARRLSLFLNPAGTDLVLLAEPQDRSLRLDHLEMEYYRALLRQPELRQHLFKQGQPIRYSHACRDVSVRLPQDQVALHAAIGARAVRTSVAEPSARIKVWRAQSDLTVVAHEIEVSAYAEMTVGNWTVAIPHQLLREISEQRQARLPNETGGVLVGVFDTQHRRVYIVDLIPSPADSQESPTGYIRGVEGVAAELTRIGECTGRQVVYVGEWHSHPDRYPVKPSETDKHLFASLQRERQAEGLPAVMAIAGERGITGWYVADISTGGGEYTLPG
jgi:integrative and conjugative element protein (TIGR02256 family)